MDVVLVFKKGRRSLGETLLDDLLELIELGVMFGMDTQIPKYGLRIVTDTKKTSVKVANYATRLLTAVNNNKIKVYIDAFDPRHRISNVEVFNGDKFVKEVNKVIRDQLEYELNHRKYGIFVIHTDEIPERVAEAVGEMIMERLAQNLNRKR